MQTAEIRASATEEVHDTCEAQAVSSQVIDVGKCTGQLRYSSFCSHPSFHSVSATVALSLRYYSSLCCSWSAAKSITAAAVSSQFSGGRPPSNCVNWHLSTGWSMVYCWPHSQALALTRSHLYSLETWPWRVWKRPPVTRYVQSWLITEADIQSALQRAVVLTAITTECILYVKPCGKWGRVDRGIRIHRPICFGFSSVQHVVGCQFSA